MLNNQCFRDVKSEYTHSKYTCHDIIFILFIIHKTGVGELSVFCQSYFNKTLIGQAGSIGGKARQEVGVEQRD